ncbi:unnamed protein product, partial [Chrysoparadoxa australica]
AAGTVTDPAKHQHCDYTLDIESADQGRSASASTSSAAVETWMVCNQLGGRGAQAIASDTRWSHMKLVPWAGVAARLRTSSGSLTAKREQPTGKAYCFLPLPVSTGLPVHINGYFELSSNRRDIWSGQDMAGDGQVRSDWNRLLISEIAMACYGRLLLAAREELGPGHEYDCLWPCKQLEDEMW